MERIELIKSLYTSRQAVIDRHKRRIRHYYLQLNTAIDDQTSYYYKELIDKEHAILNKIKQGDQK